MKQHWVPQYYFRMFTQGSDAINLITRASLQPKYNAPIRGQSAKPNFYGSFEVEQKLCELEGRHSIALRRLRNLAQDCDDAEMSRDEHLALLEAILLQRSRTLLAYEKQSNALSEMMTAMFCHYVRQTSEIESRQSILDEIERGRCQVSFDRTALVLQEIGIHLSSCALIADLEIYGLINRTNCPFVFSDSPVVFHNAYYGRVSDRGVLGLQSPGLQIFFPLDEVTAFMLIDPATYKVIGQTAGNVDIINVSDVSHLNALQIKHSENCVYFADRADESYVMDLCRLHFAGNSPPRAEYRELRHWIVNGRCEDLLMQMIEPQLSHTLSLTFLEHAILDDDQFIFRRRCPELAEEHTRRFSQWIHSMKM